MFSASRSALRSPITQRGILANVLAGLTVGIIALPLSMALAIAVGVPPQHGLYTAIVAGIVIAVSGGSAVNISGPTAAFVVVLLPIVQQHGLGGLLISGMMAGGILIVMGAMRVGILIEIVPYPVIVGFTSGIAVVIAGLQLNDFFGLGITDFHGHFSHKMWQILQAMPQLHWQDLMIACFTFAVLLLWPRISGRIPAHLLALLLASIAAWACNASDPDYQIATIGSRFHYQIGEIFGSGVPPILPSFNWPWALPNAAGEPIGFSFSLARTLLAPAMTIAILGALESLLCAVVADGMSRSRHNPNDELIGQGLGNIAAPLFGGIPATAAIARTAANVRAGGTAPLSAVVHGLFILLAILVFAPLLSYIPMPAMAALLLMVAWNMSEFHQFVRIVRIAPRDDLMTLLSCFVLTVAFDMTIAVAVGMGLAALLFIRRSINLTYGETLNQTELAHSDLPEDIAIYDINGPLFFGSAQKAMRGLSRISPEVKAVILDMSEVTMIDMSAIVAMESIVEELTRSRVGLVINNLEPRMILKLRRAGLRYKKGEIVFARNLDEAVKDARALILNHAD